MVISLVAAVIVFVLLLQLPVFSYFKSRLEKIVQTLLYGGAAGDSSSNTRLYAFIVYFDIFLMFPLFGAGYGNASKFTITNVVSHSTIGELLGCTGFLGFLAFELLLIIPLVLLLKEKQKNILIPLLLYMLFFQFFISSVYYSKFEYIFIGIAFSFVKPNYFKKKILKIISDNNDIMYEVINI